MLSSNFPERLAVAQRHHQVEDPGGDEFRLEFGIEIFQRKSQRFRQLFLVDLGWLEGGFFLRHGDALRAAVLEPNFHGQNSGAGLLHDVHAAFLRGNHAEFGQKEPCANDRMAGELQLFFGGEDAEAGERAVVGGLLHEDGFGEIHFAGDGQHLIVGEAVAVGNHGERIALEARGGEDVERVEAMLHGWVLSFRPPSGSNSLELADCPFVLDIAGVQSGSRFDQDDVHFFVGHGAVLDAARHDDEFAFADHGFAGRGISCAACLSRREKVHLRCRGGAR